MSELIKMNQASEMALNKMLGELQDSGAIQIASLLPSLGGVLSDPDQGGFPGKAFFGEVKGFQKAVEMPSTLSGDPNETHEVDVLEVRDITGDYAKGSFAFYAGNGGLKAKVGKVKAAKLVLIYYAGELEARKDAPKAWNKPKDFGFIIVNDRAVGQKLYDTAKGYYAKRETAPAK